MGKWVQLLMGRQNVAYDDLECYEEELNCARKAMDLVYQHPWSH